MGTEQNRDRGYLGKVTSHVNRDRATLLTGFEKLRHGRHKGSSNIVIVVVASRMALVFEEPHTRLRMALSIVW